MKNPLLKPAGDSALLLQWDMPVNPEMNKFIIRFMRVLKQHLIPGVVELVPAYCTLLIYYDPAVTDCQRLSDAINSLCPGELKSSVKEMNSRTVTIPVFYGGRHGPDLESIAHKKAMSVEEVIQIHCRPSYYVYMMGFLPGFPFLGFVDHRIAAHRRKEPRTLVEAGSVGIAGRQTGIYSLNSPGGWQIIGRTPIRIFKPKQEEFLLRTGDWVVFKPMNQGVRFNEIDPDAWGDFIG